MAKRAEEWAIDATALPGKQSPPLQKVEPKIEEKETKKEEEETSYFFQSDFEEEEEPVEAKPVEPKTAPEEVVVESLVYAIH